MARMMPFRPHKNVTWTENWVFNEFQNDPALSQYICLHSLGLARHNRKSYAESDFVVIGPKGVFCLEVKGGPVERVNGVWRIGGPGGYESSEGPFKQSQSARGALIGEVRRRGAADVLKRVPFGWGVVFPSITFHIEDPEWDIRCIFDERDKSHPISKYIFRLAEFTRGLESEHGRSYPSEVAKADVEKLAGIFRSDFDLIPRIGSLVKESQTELQSLTDEQYRILDIVVNDGNPRVLCEGAAGTGKTLVAAECARRHHDHGRSVLFLCFNINLRDYLAQQEFAAHGNITVDTIWNFLTALVKRSGGEFSGLKLHSADIAKLAEDAVIALTDVEQFEPFDVLILDEAQDVLEPGLMNALDWILKGSIKNGRWAFFLDSGSQAGIYNRVDDALLTRLKTLSMSLPLSINMRNPRNVALQAAQYAGIPAPECRRSLPAHVDYRTSKGKGGVHGVAQGLLTELIKDGVKANEIALLSFLKPAEAFFSAGFEKIGKSTLVLDASCSRNEADAFVASSISAFKGLEAEIVIIGDVPEPPLTKWAQAAMYVAITRAKTSVYVIASEKFIEDRMTFS